MFHKWVDRRDFLLMGSAAAVGVAATSASAGSFHAIRRIDGADPILSVGFAADADSHVVAANSLRLDDAGLPDAVRLTVHGLWSAESQAARQAVHVSAFFHAGTAEPVPFLAWSSTISTPPRVSFTMDLAGRRSLSLGIERERIVSPRLRHSRFGRALAADDRLPNAAVLERAGGLCTLGGGGPRLHRGTYFFALRRSVWDRTPDWSSISVDAVQLRGGGETPLRRGNAGVDFDYVAISVDAA